MKNERLRWYGFSKTTNRSTSTTRSSIDVELRLWLELRSLGCQAEPAIFPFFASFASLFLFCRSNLHVGTLISRHLDLLTEFPTNLLTSDNCLGHMWYPRRVSCCSNRWIVTCIEDAAQKRKEWISRNQPARIWSIQSFLLRSVELPLLCFSKLPCHFHPYASFPISCHSISLMLLAQPGSLMLCSTRKIAPLFCNNNVDWIPLVAPKPWPNRYLSFVIEGEWEGCPASSFLVTLATVMYGKPENIMSV